jgi:hypothetical protein
MIDFLLGVPGKLKAIADYLTTHWTSARAAKLDFLTANVAVASTSVSNLDYTSAKAAFLDAAISGRLGSIKSIQSGSISMAGGATTANATISSVNLTRSILLFGGCTSNASDLGGMCTVHLASATVVTATRQLPVSDSAARFMVVEFNA